MRKRLEKWQVELNLRFPGVPWKFRVGFDYEWKAWLIAYELKEKEPSEFTKLPLDEQELVSYFVLKRSQSSLSLDQPYIDTKAVINPVITAPTT